MEGWVKLFVCYPLSPGQAVLQEKPNWSWQLRGGDGKWFRGGSFGHTFCRKMCRPGELTAKYFASKTCLISFWKPFQWRWNCLVSVHDLTPGGLHNGQENRWVVTDTSCSVAGAAHTRGSIPMQSSCISPLTGSFWCQGWDWIIILSF